MPPDYSNDMMRRQLVMTIVDNVDHFYPLFKPQLQGTYGDGSHRGPYSLKTWLLAQLSKSMWGDQMILQAVSFCWNVSIIVVNGAGLWEVPFRTGGRQLRDVDLVVMYDGSQHYSAAGRLWLGIAASLLEIAFSHCGARDRSLNPRDRCIDALRSYLILSVKSVVSASGCEDDVLQVELSVAPGYDCDAEPEPDYNSDLDSPSSFLLQTHQKKAPVSSLTLAEVIGNFWGSPMVFCIFCSIVVPMDFVNLVLLSFAFFPFSL